MSIISFKPGVNAVGIQPAIAAALSVAADVYRSFGRALTVTSLEDGKHMSGSLHYQGLAADLRTRDLAPGEASRIVRDLSRELGNDYDVVLESDHIHVEYDPARGPGVPIPDSRTPVSVAETDTLVWAAVGVIVLSLAVIATD